MRTKNCTRNISKRLESVLIHLPVELAGQVCRCTRCCLRCPRTRRGAPGRNRTQSRHRTRQLLKCLHNIIIYGDIQRARNKDSYHLHSRLAGQVLHAARAASRQPQVSWRSRGSQLQISCRAKYYKHVRKFCCERTRMIRLGSTRKSLGVAPAWMEEKRAS